MNPFEFEYINNLREREMQADAARERLASQVPRAGRLQALAGRLGAIHARMTGFVRRPATEKPPRDQPVIGSNDPSASGLRR